MAGVFDFLFLWQDLDDHLVSYRVVVLEILFVFVVCGCRPYVDVAVVKSSSVVVVCLSDFLMAHDHDTRRERQVRQSAPVPVSRRFKGVPHTSSDKLIVQWSAGV